MKHTYSDLDLNERRRISSWPGTLIGGLILSASVGLHVLIEARAQRLATPIPEYKAS